MRPGTVRALRTVAVAVVLVVLVVWLVAAVVGPVRRPAVATQPDRWARSHHLTEDDPGWQCASMGNGKCGPGPLGRRQ
jgi:hypothetical protein